METCQCSSNLCQLEHGRKGKLGDRSQNHHSSGSNCPFKARNPPATEGFFCDQASGKPLSSDGYSKSQSTSKTFDFPKGARHKCAHAGNPRKPINNSHRKYVGDAQIRKPILILPPLGSPGVLSGLLMTASPPVCLSISRFCFFPRQTLLDQPRFILHSDPPSNEIRKTQRTGRRQQTAPNTPAKQFGAGGPHSLSSPPPTFSRG